MMNFTQGAYYFLKEVVSALFVSPGRLWRGDWGCFFAFLGSHISAKILHF